MACWITLKKEGNQVFFADDTPFVVGQRVGMGLGKIELRNTPKAGLHVVRFSGSGHFSYSLKLTRDGEYRLGPNRGHRVVTPSEETDPIKRVLREMEIPVSKLRRMNEREALPISTFSCDIWRAYPEGTTNNYYITDGREETKITSYKDMTPVNQHCGPEVHEAGYIANATYAIEVVKRVHMNSSIGTYIGEVAVWPTCDPTILANALAPVVYGDGADAEYVEALKNFEAACRWIAKKFEIAPHPDKGDRVVVNGSDFLVESKYLREPRVLDRLLRKHGVRLIEEHLSDEQRFFLRAKQNVEEATRYVFAHYRVVAVKRGDERHLKFALKSSPDKLGDIDSVYLNYQEELPLETLLETHKSLKDVLFVQAEERMELVPTYPQPSSFKLKDEVWEAEAYSDQKGWHKYPLVREEDAIAVTLGKDEFSGALLCLSDPERRQGVKSSMGGFHAVMRDGDEAYIDAFTALLLVRPGETKNFVFRISHAWSSPGSGASIWGITVRRTEAGMVYEPYDNGKLYTCAGYWGSEVSAQPLA